MTRCNKTKDHCTYPNFISLLHHLGVSDWMLEILSADLINRAQSEIYLTCSTSALFLSTLVKDLSLEQSKTNWVITSPNFFNSSSVVSVFSMVSWNKAPHIIFSSVISHNCKIYATSLGCKI